MPSQYIVVLSIDPIAEGAIYSANESLPLHCTLMHWFSLSPRLSQEDLEAMLRALASRATGSQQLITDEKRLFGPHNDVPVWTLKRPEEALLMHTCLLVFLAQYDSHPSDFLHWVGASWRPHVTVVDEKPVRPNTKMTARHLVLIERGENKVKLVRAVFLLG